MPTITANNVLSGSARGTGMHVKLDPALLRQLSEPNAAGGFDLDYVVGIEGGGGMIAKLWVRLEDEHGLFAGQSIVAVLANLVQQAVEARLGNG